MKASELISELYTAISRCGDLDILIRSPEDGWDCSDIEVCPDPPAPEEKEQGIAGTIDINAVTCVDSPNAADLYAARDALEIVKMKLKRTERELTEARTALGKAEAQTEVLKDIYNALLHEFIESKARA